METAEKTEFSFELNVPSGVMVVGNDFRDHFKVLGTFNSGDGFSDLIKTSRAMAEIGCAHAFVGNTCPRLYRVGENKFVIASENDGKIEGERLASIVTDLWWYSIVDGDEFNRRECGGYYKDAKFVNVKSGVYRFTHTLVPERDYPEVQEFTRVEWVREPDPVRDFAAEDAAKNFTAGQVIGHEMRKHPEYYSGPHPTALRAFRIFCGGSNEFSAGNWHENGFVLCDAEIPVDAPEVEIPMFGTSYAWLDMTGDEALSLAADGKISLNPSFAKLAINVAQCIANYHSDQKDRNVSIAKRCLKKLEKLYPDAVLS